MAIELTTATDLQRKAIRDSLKAVGVSGNNSFTLNGDILATRSITITGNLPLGDSPALQIPNGRIKLGYMELYGLNDGTYLYNYRYDIDNIEFRIETVDNGVEPIVLRQNDLTTTGNIYENIVVGSDHNVGINVPTGLRSFPSTLSVFGDISASGTIYGQGIGGPNSLPAHAASHAAGGSDPLAPNNIGAAWAQTTTSATLTDGSTTEISAARNLRYEFVYSGSSVTTIRLPYSGNLSGDEILIVWVAGGLTGNLPVERFLGASWSSIATITARPAILRFRFSGSVWSRVSVDTHTHAAADITDSANWQSTFTTVCANSGFWGGGSTLTSAVTSPSTILGSVSGIVDVRVVTQTIYNAISPKSPTTLYIIV